MRDCTERDTDLCDTALVTTAVSPPASAGPIDAEEAARLPRPPVVQMRPLPLLLRFNQRQIEFVFGAKRRLGDVFAIRTPEPYDLVITSLPDDVRSLFTAKPEEAPSLAAESPLRPIVGPNSVLTSRRRAPHAPAQTAPPPFHGEAIERYAETIAEAAEKEIDSWPLGVPFSMASRMQAITLDVIMAGIFGIEGKPAPGTPEHRLRRVIKGAGQCLDQADRPDRGADERPPRGAGRLHPRRAGAGRPRDGRGDRAPGADPTTSTSGATSSRCCCWRGPRRARS